MPDKVIEVIIDIKRQPFTDRQHRAWSRFWSEIFNEAQVQALQGQVEDLVGCQPHPKVKDGK